jgi:hypothetical protein
VRGAAVGSPAAMAMCAASLDYVRNHPELLTRLRDNTAYLKSGLRRLGLALHGDDIAPIAAQAAPALFAAPCLPIIPRNTWPYCSMPCAAYFDTPIARNSGFLRHTPQL